MKRLFVESRPATPLERARRRYVEGEIDAERFEYEVWRMLESGFADRPGVSCLVGADAPRILPMPRLFA